MPALAINVADAGARRSAEAAEPPRHPTLQTLVRVSLHPSKHLASLPYTLHERRQLITTGAEPQGELEIQLVRPRPISSRSDSVSLRGSGMLGSLCAGGLPLNARTRFYQRQQKLSPTFAPSLEGTLDDSVLDEEAVVRTPLGRHVSCMRCGSTHLQCALSVALLGSGGADVRVELGPLTGAHEAE